MILHEVLPRAAAAGLSVSRIGIAGESMGGYGALLLAEQLSAHGGDSKAAATSQAGPAGQAHQPPGGPVTAVAVAALSPAIFASYPDAIAANRGSFDSQADFARNNVQSGISALRQVPAWISAGTQDPFLPETDLLRTRLAALTGHQPAGGLLPGCHDDAFFARNLPAALSFVAGQLSSPAG